MNNTKLDMMGQGISYFQGCWDIIKSLGAYRFVIYNFVKGRRNAILFSYPIFAKTFDKRMVAQGKF